MIFPLTLVDGKIEEGRTRRKHNIIGMTSYYGEDHNTLIATFVFELSCPVANEFLLHLHMGGERLDRSVQEKNVVYHS